MGANGRKSGLVHSCHARTIVLAGITGNVHLQGNWANGGPEVKHSCLENETDNKFAILPVIFFFVCNLRAICSKYLRH